MADFGNVNHRRLNKIFLVLKIQVPGILPASDSDRYRFYDSSLEENPEIGQRVYCTVLYSTYNSSLIISVQYRDNSWS